MKKNYQNIIKTISYELSFINDEINKMVSATNYPLEKNITDLIFENSKKIRSVITILFIKALYQKITKKQLKICAIIELLHNASLIHDDIIDNSDFRREKPSLRMILGNKQAVLTGDLLLSVAQREISKINNEQISLNISDTFLKMCYGEFNQIKERNRIISIKEYLHKSAQKTAELFKTVLFCSLLAENQTEHIKTAEKFGKNFGIAFQIRDDINDIYLKENNKKCYEDIQNGIYTAPVIYFLQENNVKNIDKKDFEKIKNNKYLVKTNKLCSTYIKKALDLIADFSDNQYKQILIEICMIFEKGQNYEHGKRK